MKTIVSLFVIVALGAQAVAQTDSKRFSTFREGPVSSHSTAKPTAAHDVTIADTVKIYELKEIVVTATRREKNPFEIGRSISLITNDQIKNSIYTNVAELLSLHAGLYIVGTGQNPGMLQSIFTRGAASNQTTIMIDEVRITDPSSVSNALDLSELSFAGSDRIEIVRGPHSTLYGSSAIGGVVNIFTQTNRKPGLNTRVELRAGTFGSGSSAFSENVFLNYTDPVGFYVNAEINNSNIDGLDATVDTVTNPTVFNNRDKDGFDKRDVIGKIGFKDDRSDVYASYKNANHNTDIDKGAYTDDDNSTLDFKRNLFTYGGSHRISSDVEVKFLGGYSDMKRLAVDDSSVVDKSGTTDGSYFDGTWKGTMSTNEIQGNIKLNGLEGVIGGGYYKETMTSQTYFFLRSPFGVFESRTDLDTLNLNSSTKNIFAHIDLYGSLVDEMLSDVILTLGARLNDHSNYGSNLTYEINPSMKVGDRALVYASYSTGFNAPSLYQLHAPDRNYISDITRGNENLKPEKSESYEIGFKQSINNSISLTVAYFNTVIRDAIENVYLWDKSIGIDTLGNDWTRDDFRGDTYLNVSRQATNGVEFTLDSKISDKLYFSGNFSVVSGKLTYNPSDIDPSQSQGNHVQIFNNGAFMTREVESLSLVRRPNTVNLNLTYMPLQQLALRIDVRHAGPRSDIFYDSQLGPFGALGTLPVADYTILDFSQRFDFNEHLSIGSRIENVLDTTYSEINGFTTRGRGVYVSVRYATD